MTCLLLFIFIIVGFLFFLNMLKYKYMNNKKTLIITFLTILLLSTNAFILFLGSISRIVLANKTGFSSLICFKLKNLVFVKKILIFIGIFAIFYIFQERVFGFCGIHNGRRLIRCSENFRYYEDNRDSKTQA